jgi:hypothetical protein
MSRFQPASSRTPTLEEAVLTRNALAQRPQTSNLKPQISNVRPVDRAGGSSLRKEDSEPPRSWQGQWGGLEASLFRDQHGEEPGQWGQLPNHSPDEKGYRYGQADGTSSSDGTGRDAEWHSEWHEGFDESEAGYVKRAVSGKERKMLCGLRQSGAGQTSVWRIPELKAERIRTQLGKKGTGRLAFGRPQSVMASRPVSRDPRLTHGSSTLTLTKPRPLSYAPFSTLPLLGGRERAAKKEAPGAPLDQRTENVRPYTALGTYHNDRVSHNADLGSPQQRPHSVLGIENRGQTSVRPISSAAIPSVCPDTSGSLSLTHKPQLNPSKPLRAQTTGPCFQCASQQAQQNWLRTPGTAFETPLPWAQSHSLNHHANQCSNTAETGTRRSRTAFGQRKGTRGDFPPRAQTSTGHYRTADTFLGGDDVINDDICLGHVPKSDAVSGLYRSCLALEGRLRSLELLSQGGVQGSRVLEGTQAAHTRRPHTALLEETPKEKPGLGGLGKRPATSIGGQTVHFDKKRTVNTAPQSSSTERFMGSNSNSRPLDFSSCHLDSPKPSSPSVNKAPPHTAPVYYSQARVMQTVDRLHNLAADMGHILLGHSEETKRLAAVTITRHARGFLCRTRFKRGVRALREWRREEFAGVRGLMTAWLKRRAGQEVKMKAMRAVRQRREVRRCFRGWQQEVSSMKS